MALKNIPFIVTGKNQNWNKYVSFLLKNIKNVIHQNVDSIYLTVVKAWAMFTFCFTFMKSFNFYEPFIYSFHIPVLVPQAWHYLGTKMWPRTKQKSLHLQAYNIGAGSRNKERKKWNIRSTWSACDICNEATERWWRATPGLRGRRLSRELISEQDLNETEAPAMSITGEREWKFQGPENKNQTNKHKVISFGWRKKKKISRP